MRIDLVSLVGGLAVLALGVVLLLDQAGTIELTFAYVLPALTATLGAILLASGLSGGRS